MARRRYNVTIVRDEVFSVDVIASSAHEAAYKARRGHWEELRRVQDAESSRFRVRDVTRAPEQPRRGRRRRQ